MHAIIRKIGVVALTLGLAVPLVGQAPSSGSYSGPRTPWGDPTHMVGVPFERPDRFGGSS